MPKASQSGLNAFSPVVWLSAKQVQPNICAELLIFLLLHIMMPWGLLQLATLQKSWRYFVRTFCTIRKQLTNFRRTPKKIKKTRCTMWFAQCIFCATLSALQFRSCGAFRSAPLPVILLSFLSFLKPPKQSIASKTEKHPKTMSPPNAPKRGAAQNPLKTPPLHGRRGLRRRNTWREPMGNKRSPPSPRRLTWHQMSWP